MGSNRKNQNEEKTFQDEIQSIKKVVKMDVDEWRYQSGNQTSNKQTKNSFFLDFRQDGPVEMRPKKSKMRV